MPGPCSPSLGGRPPGAFPDPLLHPSHSFPFVVLSARCKQRKSAQKRRISLTFDDGPDPLVTPRILEHLAAAGVPAVFFVTGERAARHPELIGRSSRRDTMWATIRGTMTPCSCTARCRPAREVAEAQRIFMEAGIRPRVFRPPVGITNPRLPVVLREADLICVTFSRRGADWGNRRVAGLAGRLLRGVRSGDILLLHDVSPPGSDGADRWLAEVGELLRGLRERSLGMVLLSDLIGQSVMERISGPGKKGFAPTGQE